MQNTQFRTSFWKSKKIAKSFFGAILGVFIFAIVNTYAFPIYSIFASVPLSITGPTSYYTQATTAWTSTGILASGGLGGYVYSLTDLPVGSSIDPVTGIVSFTPPSAGQYTFTVEVTDAGGATADHSFILDVYATSVCVWTGGVSTAWTNAANWSYCGGSAPISTSDVAIASQATYMPIVAANTTVNSFGLGPGGGTITLNATVVFTVTSTTSSMRSSVGFSGGVTTCTTCNLRWSGDFAVLDGATLTLNKGITAGPASGYANLNLGNGTTSGNLETGAAGLQSEWPTINTLGSSIVLNGSASKKSRIKINGINLKSTSSPGYNTVQLTNWWEITQFDNVFTDARNGVGPNGGNSIINFASCTNGLVTDTTWAGMYFDSPPGPGSYNINASGTNCSTLPVITVSNNGTGGSAYGAIYENDPNAKINWLNDSSSTCTWTGAVDSVWTKPGNWSGCTNGRGNYPDQLDYVIIPVTATQPVVSANATIQGFASSGGGGGTVTINAGIRLYIQSSTNSIRSDVKLQGNTTTCTTCQLYSLNNLTVSAGATLTLLKGITVQFTNNYYDLLLGNGTSGGNLKTGPAGTAAEWPRIDVLGRNIVANGASGQRSTIDVDGINLSSTQGGTYSNVDLIDWFDVVKFDNVKLSVRGGGISSVHNTASAYVRIRDCTNANFTATTWNNLNFVDPIHQITPGYNVRADGTNCSSMPTITMSPHSTGGGMAYGADFENDPNSKISWSNSTGFTCTWTGATNTSWTTSTNWSGCTNGRLNYPDQLDSVIIPVTANQPTVSANAIIKGFALSGSGGGTLTVNAGVSLYLVNSTSTVRSDIQFQGATTTCTNCIVLGLGHLKITDSAKLTLLKGVNFGPSWGSGSVYVGDGTTSGTLATGAAGLSTEWPVVTSYRSVYVQGSASARSVLNVDGLFINGPSSTDSSLVLSDWYEVKKLDSLKFANTGNLVSGYANLKMPICTNALMTSKTWSFANFTQTPGAGAYNVDASGTNCSTLPVINMYQATGTGAGAAKENDPNSKINWTNVYLTGTSSFITQVGTAWSNTFTASGGTPAYTYSLQTAPGGATVNASTGQVDFIPGTPGTYTFVLRATESGPGTYMDFTFTVDAYATSVCVWTGGTSTTWGTAANWTFCGGSAPIATSDVAISSTATYMPVLLSNTTVNSFGEGPGGGTITVNATITLTITAATNSIRSSVKFQGGVTNCSTCFVRGTSDLYVVKDATVTLLKGIGFGPGPATNMFFGDGSTGGSLKTGTAGTSAEWPSIVGSNHKGLYFNGASSHLSRMQVDGINFNNFYPYSQAGPIVYNNWYAVDQFDNVNLSYPLGSSNTSAYIKFVNCTNATITDTTWSAITFTDMTSPGSSNIDASGINCSGMSAISVSNPAGTSGGAYYGSLYENDPNNKISWANSSSLACVWTGAVNTAWSNSGNWNSCSNGRSNVPDQLDTALIPVTANQPIVAANTSVAGIGAGTGGGTITINAGITLGIVKGTASLRSDVKFQGATTTCTTCYVKGNGDLYITDDSTVTLLKGIRFSPNSGKTLFLGDGSTGGSLATGPAGTSAEFPQFGGINVNNAGITVNGASGHLSRINFDGMVVRDYYPYANPGGIYFQNYYEVQKFDGVTLTSATSPVSGVHAVNFASCTSGTITDTTWSDFVVTYATNPSFNNIKANGTNCSTSLPVITVSNPTGTAGGFGYGPIYEADPGAKITWSNSSTSTCTWTGASNTAWTNPSNWSGCSNGRAGYPDQLDKAVIPVTANQPVISAMTMLGQFSGGTGGGTVTVNSNQSLIMSAGTKTFESDVKFQGATTTCTNCQVIGRGNLTIENDATLTLLKGIKLGPNWQGTIYIGNGAVGGKLATGPAGTSAEWPTINYSQHGGLVFNGTTGQPAIISVSGLNMTNFYPYVMTAGFYFGDWVQIDNFDSVNFTGNTMGSNTRSEIKFTDCGNLAVADTTWTGLIFGDTLGGSYNVDASGINCSALPTININGATGSGACTAVGAGACALENDPNSKINWN